ncbi:MAG: helix-turn-helix domain-containing protein [Prolixibacteraceae bacterium]|nr:helix-turn-helix domain-containing protein [Prolixibacteraceae bacterium]
MVAGLLNGILIFGIVQALFFALLFATKKRLKIPDVIIGIWLFVLTAHILLIFVHVNHLQLPSMNIPILFTLLHGPFLYLYTNSLINNHEKIYYSETLHFTPFIAGIIFSLLPFNTLKIIALAGITSGIAYCTATLIIVSQHREKIKDNFSFTDKINLKWLFVLSIGMFLIWAGATILVILNRFFYFSFNLTWFFVVIPVFIFYVGFYGIRQQVIYPAVVSERKKDEEEITNLKKSNGYKKSGLTTEKMKSIQKVLEETMENEKFFLEPGLNLAELSKKINIPTHHITQTLNEYSGKTFFDFVNSKRVDEFRRRVQNHDHQYYSLLGIAFDCGFNSKSSFNRIFKKTTGTSPSEYIKHLKKQS